MDIEFITDKPGIVRSQHRPMSGPLPQWVALEATKMGGTLADGLWHYRRVDTPVGTAGSTRRYYVFGHAQM